MRVQHFASANERKKSGGGRAFSEVDACTPSLPPPPFLGQCKPHLRFIFFLLRTSFLLARGGDSRGTPETVAANTAGQDRHTLTEWATRDFQSTKGPFVCGGIRFPYVNSSVPRPLPSVAQWPTGQDCSSSAANEKKRRPMQKLQPISARKIEDDRLYVCPGYVGMIYLNFIPKDENGKTLFVLTFFQKVLKITKHINRRLAGYFPSSPSLLFAFWTRARNNGGRGQEGPSEILRTLLKVRRWSLVFLTP